MAVSNECNEKSRLIVPILLARIRWREFVAKVHKLETLFVAIVDISEAIEVAGVLIFAGFLFHFLDGGAMRGLAVPDFVEVKRFGVDSDVAVSWIDVTNDNWHVVCNRCGDLCARCRSVSHVENKCWKN